MHVIPALLVLILLTIKSSFALDNAQLSPQPIDAPGLSRQVWTLQSSIQRGVTVAPDLRAAEGEIAARTGNLTEAAAWPNPTVGVRADEKLGIENGRGGYSLNQLTISQPLPLNRLEHQRRAAEGRLEAARSAQRYQSLLLETRAAQAFHTLQQAAERQMLAQERLAFAEKMQPPEVRQGVSRSSSDRLVRYLSPLERARLDILRASAHQDVAEAEGKWSESLAQFRALLALPLDAQPETSRLQSAEVPPELSALLKQMEDHPALRATQLTRDASNASVDAARAQRKADPVLSLIYEQDYFAGERRSYTGVMLAVQIPVWNRNDGGVARAYGEAEKAEAVLEMQRRDLSNRLRQAHLHLGHLIEQAEHYRSHLLQPARQVFELTQKGYGAGEQNGLALVDASNTYFDTQARYLELLRDAWIESAELRLAAGISLLDSTQGAKP